MTTPINMNGYILHLQNYSLDTRPGATRPRPDSKDQDLQKMVFSGLRTKSRS